MTVARIGTCGRFSGFESTKTRTILPVCGKGVVNVLDRRILYATDVFGKVVSPRALGIMDFFFVVPAEMVSRLKFILPRASASGQVSDR